MSAEIVKRLRAESGLTDGQIARLMGVPVRAVHHWASGSEMPPRRAERLKVIADRIFDIHAESPEDRRAHLLSSSHGKSILQQMLDDAPHDQVIQFPVPLLERLGVA